MGSIWNRTIPVSIQLYLPEWKSICALSFLKNLKPDTEITLWIAVFVCISTNNRKFRHSFWCRRHVILSEFACFWAGNWSRRHNLELYLRDAVCHAPRSFTAVRRKARISESFVIEVGEGEGEFSAPLLFYVITFCLACGDNFRDMTSQAVFVSVAIW